MWQIHILLARVSESRFSRKLLLQAEVNLILSSNINDLCESNSDEISFSRHLGIAESIPHTRIACNKRFWGVVPKLQCNIGNAVDGAGTSVAEDEIRGGNKY